MRILSTFNPIAFVRSRFSDGFTQQSDVFVRVLDALERSLGMIAHGETFLASKEMAERVGFEPTIPVKVCPLSRRIVSTTHAPLRRSSRSSLVIGRSLKRNSVRYCQRLTTID